MNKTIVITSIVLLVAYFALFRLATFGYGYMGYYGYHRGPSFWYFGGPSTYYEKSNRSGSVSGPSHRGGGPGSGK